MQYFKLGPIRIPYKIKITRDKKIFQICGIKIPFSSFDKDGQKYYKLFFFSFRFPFIDKYFA